MAQDAYLLDTVIASAGWSEKYELHAIVRSKLDAIGTDRVFISSVTTGEVEWGLRVAEYVDAEQQQLVRDAMAAYPVLHVDRHTSESYGAIRAELYRALAPRDSAGRRRKLRYIEDLQDPVTGKQLGIEENDLWIVSVAVQYNLVFATNDQGPGMRAILTAADYWGRTQIWT